MALEIPTAVPIQGAANGKGQIAPSAPHSGGNFWWLSLGALGVVFGDIGTSPLYALQTALGYIKDGGIGPAETIGIVSLIIWALLITVTAKYVLFLMFADNKGEGGILSLMALARGVSGNSAKLVFFLGVLGSSLFSGAFVGPVLDIKTPFVRTGAFAELEGVVRSLHRVVRDVVPALASGDEAAQMATLFAEAERVAASGLSLCTPVVVSNGSFTKEGHGSAAQWLGSLSGSSESSAKGRLAAAQRATATPGLTEALHNGDLSVAELGVITRTGAEVDDAAATLLALAQGGASLQELSDTASRLRAGARKREDERARRDRVRAHRHFRVRQLEGGGVRGDFSCDEVEWAKVAPLLEARAKARWKAAGSHDGASLEAHRLDAFLELMALADAGCLDLTELTDDRADRPRRAGRGARVETLVIIDAIALRRGTTEGDELCEIEGIGPVSVAAATELLGEGGLRYLVKEGFDIKTVTRATRDIASCIEAALIARDRTCCAEGCGKRHGLERDHVEPYADDGLTELDNLVRLCPQHHALKTYAGWTIQGEPGNWRWVAPENPKSAGALSRARKVATAKAKAKAEAKAEENVRKDRNTPRRT